MKLLFAADDENMAAITKLLGGLGRIFFDGRDEDGTKTWALEIGPGTANINERTETAETMVMDLEEVGMIGAWRWVHQ